MSDFVNLHVHSEYSVLDGLSSPEELVLRAKELGQTALSITEHGTLSSHRAFQKAAMDNGIKPILGLEAYFTKDRWDRRPVAKREDNTALYSHLIILAKNNNGLKNLNKIAEESWKSYYYKPLIDLELLSEYGDDLIITTACMGGVVSKLILGDKQDVARDLLIKLKNRFEDDLFIEVQSHNPPELNTQLLQFSKDLGIRPVAATDAHYASEKDRAVEEALLILSTHPKAGKDITYAKSQDYKDVMDRYNYLYPGRQMTFDGIDLYLQSREDMRKAFLDNGIDRGDIFDNTLEIESRVGSYEYLKGLDLLPKPTGVNPDVQLRELCEAGLKKRGVNNEEYNSRLSYELDIITRKNFSTYFLIVRDIVQWAKNSGILVGPARGSAAGSLVCYALYITEVDPLEYNLLFDRFINAERNDFPDIDLDFEDRRRSEVKEYIRKRFGNEKVASISTYSYFRDKGVFRDAARTFMVPLGDVNKFLKTAETFEDCETNPEGQWFRNKYPEVVDLARKLRGRIRGVGIHAAGVVISNKPISDYAPVETRVEPGSATKNRVPVIAYDMSQAEDVGLIKIDALGLKTLSVISDTIKIIKERRGRSISLNDIDMEDELIYRDLTNGFTKGVFQAEAAPYTALLVKMGVSSFNDLVASNALVRPGAMNAIGDEYISRRHGLSQTKSIHPVYDDITKETLGLVIYQEQIMLLCVELADMSWSDADKIRKIIGKKKDVREFDAYKEKFIDGASQNISTDIAEHLWTDFEKSANYSFNKSHAVSYSKISYWCAWLKHYYPVELLYSILKNESDKDVRTEYLIEAKRLGIKILLPHINDSELDFTIDGDSIRFGLTSIKYISDNVGSKIIAARPFKSYEELLERSKTKGSGINSRAISAMNAIGAATFTDNPKTGKEHECYYEYLGVPDFHSNIPDEWSRQINTLDKFSDSGVHIYYAMVKNVKRGTGWSRLDLVDGTGTAGVFHLEGTQVESGKMYLLLVANNRLERYIESSSLSSDSSDPLIRYLEAKSINVVEGKKAVLAFSSRRTKAGKMMATAIFINKDKSLLPALVFNKNYAKGLGKIVPGKSVEVKLSQLEDHTLYVKEIL